MSPSSRGGVLAAATLLASWAARGAEPAVPSAAPPRYSLPADRVTRWEPGLNAVGGIPARTKVHKTVSPSGADDTAAIQAALDGCPPKQVVELTAGTFRISGEGLKITRSGVVLRGAGPSKTRLVRPDTNGYPVVIVGTRWYGRIQQTPFASDGVKGARTVTLARNPGLKVGELVHVSETYDPSLTWYTPGQVKASDYLGWGEGRKGPLAESRPIGQAMEVAAIEGTRVTFTTPFHIAFRVSHAAHLSRISNGPSAVRPVTYSGVEDLYVANGDGGDGGGNIRFFAAAYCWARNVESVFSGGASFAFDGTLRCELRDSYLHSTGFPNPGGGGYGVVVDSYAADNLVENNVVWNFNKVMVMRSSGGGNVIAYNYMEDGYGAGYPTIVETGLNAAHMTTPHHELLEGNQAFNADGDSTWGNSIYITFFRNHLTSLRRSLDVGAKEGVRVPLVDLHNRRAAGLTIHHWWYSYVGNVLGYPDGYPSYPARFSPAPGGKRFRYEWTGGPFGSEAGYMPLWQLGYDGERWGKTPDPEVVSRTIRDGNYDHFTKTQHWHGPGGTGEGQTAAPSAHVLPDSLYLAGKPPFFGDHPWPWVDPKSGTLGTLPARARFDALRR